MLDHDLETLKYALLGITLTSYGVSGVLYGILIKQYPQDLRNFAN
jgi:hypothetical protein